MDVYFWTRCSNLREAVRDMVWQTPFLFTITEQYSVDSGYHLLSKPVFVEQCVREETAWPTGLLQLVCKVEGLNSSGKAMAVWAGDVAERCMCLLSHLRRIKNSVGTSAPVKIPFVFVLKFACLTLVAWMEENAPL